MAVDEVKWGGLLLSARVKDFNCGRRLWGGIARDGGFHDPGFVPGDFVDGFAEHVGVVDAQGGDGRDGGGEDNVGAVIFAADTAFDDSGLDTLRQVGVEGNKGEEAEVDWFAGGVCGEALGASSIFEAVPDLEEVFCEQGLGERLVVYLDAFTDEAQVGRGVQTDLAKGRVVLGEDIGDDSTSRPFSFGTSYMNRFETVEV